VRRRYCLSLRHQRAHCCLHLALGRLDGGDDVVHRLRISDHVTDPIEYERCKILWFTTR